ncbi:MAG: capsule assembly Wzi family protein [Bacteroidia bacterium]
MNIFEKRLRTCSVLIACLLALLGIELKAQTVPVGMPFFEDALRRAQLMGRLDADVSFMIRPVDPVRAFKIANPFGLDTSFLPLDTNRYSRYTDLLAYPRHDSSGWGLAAHSAHGRDGLPTFRPAGWKHARITLLPIYTHTRFNQNHPYGWNDGPMVPARGLQQYTSAGVFVKLGPLEAQYRPEYVWAQNSEFQNPPFRAREIDMPERMGQEVYKVRFRGQSYVKLNLGAIGMGLSTENMYWGPGIKNAIIMSNNAPGFGHFTLHSNRPIKGRWGTVEGQMVMGKLERSGFVYPRRYTAGEWPPIAGDVVPDTSGRSRYHTYINAMQAVYQPSITPGLFIGLSRVVQARGEPLDRRDYFRMLYLEPRGEQTFSGPDEDGMNRNQLVALSVRYLFKESHAEVYTEIGREDWWWDMEDLITRPRPTTAWMLGLRKLYPLAGKDQWLQLFTEHTRIQAPLDNLVRPNVSTYSFYTHGNRVGWTHRGQVLGAGIGPGSNMTTIGLTYGKGFHTLGLHFERVIYNEDLFFTEIDYLRLNPAATNPFFLDYSKRFVDWGVMFNHHTAFGQFFLGYQLHLRRTYNFQWNYDPLSLQGPFRFPGVNIWTINLELTTVYRF